MKFKEVAQLLTTLNPELFTAKFIKNPKPLPLKVHLHLIDKYLELFGGSKTQARQLVGNLLWRFTNRPKYWHKLVACPYRVDLQGKQDETQPIEIDHKINAQISLDEFHNRKYWKLANEGRFDKVLKDLITKDQDIIDLEKVFIAAGVQLNNLKAQEGTTQDQVDELLEYQTKRIVKRLYKSKGISFYAYLPDGNEFIKLLTEWYAIYKNIYAIQVNGKVYKCEAFYATQVEKDSENNLENSQNI